MKILKEYIKNNKNQQFFYNGLKEKTIEEKYQFLKNHFDYYIMNSWNGLKSIGNNIKIYNLGLTNEQQNKFFKLLEIEPDFFYNFTFDFFKEFEELTKTKIFFNGRSGGYLVLVPDFEITKRNQHIFEWFGVEDIIYFDNYKEFKTEQNKHNYKNYSFKKEIEETYYCIKAFDKFCDVLRAELIYILDNSEIDEHEETYTKTIKTIVI